MTTGKPKYKTLRDLLAHELVTEEDPRTADLIRSFRNVKRDKVLTKPELVAICRWKSPRALRYIEANHGATVRRLTRKALSTRSEQERLEYLTAIRGVGVPMASAILTLIDPQHYGVIDIRVWQVLFAMNSVFKNPKGIGFTFKQWYHYLCKLRYHAKELGVCVRAVERTLFYYHREIQEGVLYEGK
jgi:thermostable 8-oxoguanine DNA glycosylase